MESVQPESIFKKGLTDVAEFKNLTQKLGQDQALNFVMSRFPHLVENVCSHIESVTSKNDLVSKDFIEILESEFFEESSDTKFFEGMPLLSFIDENTGEVVYLSPPGEDSFWEQPCSHLNVTRRRFVNILADVSGNLIRFW